MYERFLHTNGAYYAFVECDSTLLDDTLIPEGIKWSTVPTGEMTVDDAGEDVPVTRQKTLREFVVRTFPSATSGMEIFALAAMESPCYRHKAVTEQDISEWLSYLAQFGVTEADLLDIEQFQAVQAALNQEQ